MTKEFLFYKHPPRPESHLVANPDAPEFSEAAAKAYNDNASRGGYTNCYEYAINGERGFDMGMVDPGLTVTLDRFRNPKYTKEMLTEAVVADGLLKDTPDLEHKNGIPFKPGYYAVALFIHENADYHFMRQNRDGTWSQSNGTNVGITHLMDDEGNISNRNPHELKGFGAYNFTSYFLVPKEGIDGGVDTKLDKMAAEGYSPQGIIQQMKLNIATILPEKEHNLADGTGITFKTDTFQHLPDIGQLFKEFKMQNPSLEAPQEIFGFIPMLRDIAHQGTEEQKGRHKLCEFYCKDILSMENKEMAAKLLPLEEQMTIEFTGKKPDGTLPVYLYNPDKTSKGI